MKQLASSKSARNALARHRSRGKRFGFLRERLGRLDVEAVWVELERGLTLGSDRVHLDQISAAIDEVDDRTRKAGMIAHAASEELEEFTVHWRSAYAEWERTAREVLEKAKKEKRTSGIITNDAVENWIARHVGDYARWKEARRDLERNKTLSKQMADAWQSRAASLRKQADLVMTRRGTHPGMLPRRGRGGGDEDGKD